MTKNIGTVGKRTKGYLFMHGIQVGCIEIKRDRGMMWNDGRTVRTVRTYVRMSLVFDGACFDVSKFMKDRAYVCTYK